MREDEIFTPEEMKLFREVDRESALEREQAASIVPVERIAPTAIAGVMTAEQSGAWNSWANELISAQCESVAESVIKAVTKEFGNQELELRKELRTRFQGLDSELAALREENVRLRESVAFLRGASTRAPIDLPALPLQPKRNGLNG
jgi:hypothetical protein